MQTQTSNKLHNAIMEAGSKDRPPMFAPGNYVQWKSRIKRYIDTKPNHELIHYCLENPPYELCWKDKEVPTSEGSLVTRTERDGESLESYYSRFYKMMNELIKNQCIVTNQQVNVQFLLQLQPEWQRIPQPDHNKLLPIYDQEPSMVAEDDETSKDKEIDKLMALISLSFKNKPTNNNLRTSSNTSRANQDNSSRINKNDGIQCYNCKKFGHVAREFLKPKRAKDATYHREKMLLYQELEAHYMFMAQLQQVSPDAAHSGPIFDDEPLQKVSNDDHYNVFAIESTHPEQSKSIHDTYPIEQDAQNVIID
nr:hypothetical protein [Tanacetum cinerariifolium]